MVKKVYKMKIPCVFVLLLTMLLSLMQSCHQPEEIMTDTIPLVVDGMSEYVLIRPENASDVLVEQYTRLAAAFEEMTGSVLTLKTDYIMRGEPEDGAEKEILIGKTNRPESAAAAEMLNGYGYLVTVMNQKLVIYAASDNLLRYAVDYFLDNCVYNSGTKTIAVEQALKYIGNEFDAVPFIKDGVSAYRIVRSDKAANSTVEKFVQFGNKIKETTGIDFELITDNLFVTDTEDVYEILFGETNRPQSAAALRQLGTDSYSVTLDGKKILITAYNPKMLQKAADAFIAYLKAAVYDGGDGKVQVWIESDFELRGTGGTTNTFWVKIPEYESGGARGIYDCDDDTYLLRVDDTSRAEFDAYLEKLRAEGYSPYDENDMAGNRYVTYVGEKALIQAYYITSARTARIVAERKTTLPPLASDNNYTKVTTSAVTQIQLTPAGENGLSAYGLSYLIRLADGSFIVIDGGYIPGDEDKLYNAMMEQKPGSGKPVVAAWIFTHGHGDHVGGFIESFSTKYAAMVELRRAIFNFPANSATTASRSYIQNVKSRLRLFGDSVAVHKAHTGQRYHLANAVVSILYTHEDLFPYPLDDFNDSTTVFRIEIEGQKLLFLGDVYFNGSGVLAAAYGDYLKSDFMQVSHHGYDGGTVELYRLIDPRILLWPVSEGGYNVVKNRTVNAYLLKQMNVEEVYVAGAGTVTLELPYKK